MDQAGFLASATDSIRALTVRLEAAAESLDGAAWEHSTSTRWSPAGIVQHMILANDPYLAKLPSVLEAAPSGTAAAVSHTWFGRMLLKVAGPDGNAPAPKAMHPGSGPFGKEIVKRWKEQQEAFLALIAASAEVDVCRTRFSNPFVPLFRMSVADALAIAVAHTERHVSQIEARTSE